MDAPKGQRQCKVCGTIFVSLRSAGKTCCSPECRDVAYRTRDNGRTKPWESYPAPILDESSGCLRWQGPHNPRGYGRINTKYAHREAWLRSGGIIPDGMVVDHVAARGCIHKDCVNVLHLEVVTQRENVHRGAKCIAQVAKTHCPKGHPYEGYNLIIRRGKRDCRTCNNERCNARYHKRKAEKAH